MMNKTVAAVCLLTLAGCRPSLVGDWEGEIECENANVDLYEAITAELDSQGGGEFGGDFSLVSFAAGDSNGYYIELEIEIQGEIVVEADGFGEQYLDYETDLDSVDCMAWADGELVADSCEDIGLKITWDDDEAMGDWTWDGADTIEVDDGDCEGDIER